MNLTEEQLTRLNNLRLRAQHNEPGAYEEFDKFRDELFGPRPEPDMTVEDVTNTILQPSAPAHREDVTPKDLPSDEEIAAAQEIVAERERVAGEAEEAQRKAREERERAAAIAAEVKKARDARSLASADASYEASMQRLRELAPKAQTALTELVSTLAVIRATCTDATTSAHAAERLGGRMYHEPEFRKFMNTVVKALKSADGEFSKAIGIISAPDDMADLIPTPKEKK